MNEIMNAYKKSILKESTIKEGLAEGWSDIAKYLEEKGIELTARRAELVKQLFEELSLPKETMGKVMGSYLKLLGDEIFLKKATEIREKVKAEVKLDAAQTKDVESLTTYIAELAVDAGNKNAREKAKEKLAKVLAFIEDADLAKIVKAEKALVDLVKRSV
jgi:hypothetical protein